VLVAIVIATIYWPQLTFGARSGLTASFGDLGARQLWPMSVRKRA
jgi:hypothetical protein